MDQAFRFCPRCAAALAERTLHGAPRRACPKEGCGFVHWNNPTPVVAAIVERQGAVLLARARDWPEKVFGLVTGFLEAGEAPEDGVRREVKEELGLDARVVSLVGVYTFVPRNELLVAYHLVAEGEVALGAELQAYKAVPVEKLRPWDFGTGLAVKAWLERRAARPAAVDAVPPRE